MRRVQVVTSAVCAGAIGLATAYLLPPRMARAVPPPSKLASSQRLTVPNEPINLTGPPETVLYALFFQQANGIARKAKVLQAANGSGAVVAALQDFYVEQAGLTQGENNEVFQVAADYASTNAPVDAEAKNMLAAFRSATLAYSISQGQKPEDPTSNLRLLDLQRDTNLMAARQELNTLLGTDGFYTLELYVHKTFSRARPTVFYHAAGTASQGGGQ